MNLREFFIGRPIYWALAGGVGFALAMLGINQQHVRNFVPFQFTVLALAILVVAVIVIAYKPGEQVTRETLDPADLDDQPEVD